MCVLYEYLLRRPMSIADGRNSMFLLSRHQLRTSTARRAARRGRGQRQQRSPARVGAVTR